MTVLVIALAGLAWLAASIGVGIALGWWLRHRAAPRQTLQWTQEPRLPRVLLGALALAAIVAGLIVMAAWG